MLHRAALLLVLAALPRVAAAQQTPAWQGLSGSDNVGAFGPIYGVPAALAADDQGGLYVAWQTTNPANHGVSTVFVRHWDGGSWIDLEDSDPTPGVVPVDLDTYTMKLAVDPTGHPVLAYIACADGIGFTQDVYVVRWDGSDWLPMGGLPTKISPTAGSALGLALDAAGNPSVSFLGKPNGYVDVRVKRWNGSQWVGWASASADNVSQISVTGIGMVDLDFRIDSTGRPLAIWAVSISAPPAATTYALHARRYDPATSTWTPLGSSTTGAGIANSMTAQIKNCSLACNSTGRVLATWYQGASVFAKEWDGTTWASLGSSGTSGLSANAEPACVAVTPTGRWFVAWPVYITAWTIQARRWNGTTWEDVDGSASDPGISACAPEAAHRAAVAMSPTGDIYVAWSQSPWNNPATIDLRLRAHLNGSPPMSTPTQYRVDGVTPLAPGSITFGETGFNAAVPVSADPEGDAATLTIEVRAVGDDESTPALFATTAPVIAGTMLVPVTGLPLNGQYWWRARAKDAYGATAGWRSPGTTSSSECDVWTRGNGAPVPQPATVTGDPDFFERSEAVIVGSSSDPDLDTQVFEVRFPNATYTSPAATSGTPITLRIPLSGTGRVDWSYRYGDSYGAYSPWTPGPSFEIHAGGSMSSGCGQTATGSAGLVLLALVGLLLRK